MDLLRREGPTRMPPWPPTLGKPATKEECRLPRITRGRLGLQLPAHRCRSAESPTQPHVDRCPSPLGDTCALAIGWSDSATCNPGRVEAPSRAQGEVQSV